MVVEIILLGLLFQGMLAFGVYNDAYQRGDDEGLWTVITLLFGVFGVLMYLLQRPDERLPDDEQEQSASTIGLKIVGLYGGAVIGGVIVAVLMGLVVADTFYSNDIPEGCDSLGYVESGEPTGPCEITYEESESNRGMRNLVAWTSLLGGAGLGPLGLYSLRNKEQVRERLPV